MRIRPLERLKVDWFTNLRLATLIPGPQVPAYILGKLTWTGVRLATGAPISPTICPSKTPWNLGDDGSGRQGSWVQRPVHASVH